ncbi:Oxoglutarate and iron-dependent oxygenase degradation C-term-domain-containing protein [Bisporella sp. PMI_857]|nr:Oxoglutarate and iron-dependent oxygenase degradation C-term-domain-containing protein [Bisporella sp. PMI_857]
MGKRKAETHLNGHNGRGILKKRAKTALSDEEAQKCFRGGLFDPKVLKEYTKSYAESEPYKHSVIHALVNDTLLRSVRDEIKENVHFTPKETDIYKIHQSGDLANLDGLDDAALEKLPSLLKLRDALYSESFRQYVATVTGSGDLSGRKTDMAINVYTPGCHLLCHDDVIGSRRVSYILYLTDPDIPWKEEWGGALRLYPTRTYKDHNGEKTVTPSPDFTKVIPPAWNQLSFFAVQPGESFHDVEEVYHARTKEQLQKEGGRIRMAISGWYHIPQIGEPGYIKGAEEKWGHNSSLMQLQGNPDKYDFPQQQSITVDAKSRPLEEKELEETDFDFLLKYMAPTYLTPDTLEQVSESFLELSSVTLDGLLSAKFAERVKNYIQSQEVSPSSAIATGSKGSWSIAKPPHKQRFLYQQPTSAAPDKTKESIAHLDPITELLDVFLPSRQFRQWLEIATECEVENFDILARRFRRGQDYALATSHEGQPRLEISLGLTPTPGWGADEEEDVEPTEKEVIKENNKKANDRKKVNGKENIEVEPEEDDVGGHEVYMAGDDDEAIGDAAVYKASSDADDDNVLFTMPPSWNKMSIVLRDSGVLKFVKYVSKNAKGDRWDISGAFGVKETDDNEGEEQEESQEISLEDSEEEVFNGFPDSEDSDSD